VEEKDSSQLDSPRRGLGGCRKKTEDEERNGRVGGRERCAAPTCLSSGVGRGDFSGRMVEDCYSLKD